MLEVAKLDGIRFSFIVLLTQAFCDIQMTFTKNLWYLGKYTANPDYLHGTKNKQTNKPLDEIMKGEINFHGKFNLPYWALKILLAMPSKFHFD